MKIKIEKLVDMSNEIDGIFRRHGFIVDHDILTLSLVSIIKSSYPNEEIEIEKPDLTPLLEKYGQEHIKDSQ